MGTLQSLVRGGCALLVTACVLLSSNQAWATFRVLPGVFTYNDHNAQMLSSDGTTAILGTDEIGIVSLRWTAATGAVSLPRPSSGGSWGIYGFLNADGTIFAGSGEYRFISQAWLWRAGHGTRVDASGSATYLGITKDGDCTIRWDWNLDRVYQEFATSGTTVVWARGSSGTFQGTSGDGRVLYGATASTNFLPCFWDFAGHRVVANQFIGTKGECLFGNFDGSVLLGQIHLGDYIAPDRPEIVETFRWNTLTGQIDYFFPPHFLTAAPTFISPSGNIISIFTYYDDIAHPRQVIYDSSSSDEAALGMQDIANWLVGESYLSSTQVAGRTDFIIRGMSEDESVVAGNFTDSSGQRHGFLAKRLSR